MIRINCLWVRGRLGYIERLCVSSMLAQGHEVHLFSYEPLSGVPEGAVPREAAEIMPMDRLIRYRGSGSYALGANLFRYMLLQREPGLWLDVDMLMLRPVELPGEHIFGLQAPGVVNNAVMAFPPASPVLVDLVRLMTERPTLPPWAPPAKRLAQRALRLVGWDRRPEDFHWGTFGPKALTWFLTAHGLMERAQPPSVFYPVAYDEARRLFAPGDRLEGRIGADTLGVHLWNEQIKDLKAAPPPEGSFVAEMCARHGIEPEARPAG